MQRDAYSIQEKNAERARQTAAMNAGMKLASGATWESLTPTEQTAYTGSPEVALKFEELRVKPGAETWQSLTDPAARLAAGIPAEDKRPAQISSAGEVKFPGGAATSVTFAAEKAEEAARGKGVAETMTKIADDMPEAQQFLLGSQRLSQLLSKTETGTSAGLVDFIRRNTGVALSDDADSYQAIAAAVNYLAPRMRPTGSGSASNFDANMFLNSLPSLLGTPGGNNLVAQTVGGMAQVRVENAKIARAYQAGKITAEEAYRQMDALPDPFETFKQWQEAHGAVPKGTPGAIPEGFTPDEWGALTPEEQAILNGR
jgi:hypothetical protein